MRISVWCYNSKLRPPNEKAAGTALQSCSPSNNVTNGDSSTQVYFYYLEEGVVQAWASNGVFVWNIGIDQDGRIGETDYYSLGQFFPYGTLTYTYDADGRVIDKGGTLAAISLPSSDTAAYSPTDQLTSFSPGGSTNPDRANNIINDPALGLTYTWNARNQLSAMSPGSVSETYDALGRRKTSVSGTSHNLSLIHDGSSVIGSFDSILGNTWTFLPGGLAGSLTSGGSTKTYVPLLDKDGTTIALVNTANVNSLPETTFTYDPSGVSTVSGVANSFPFLFQGLEHEVSDPGQLYFEPSGNVYNPQLQRELSLIGPQGIFAPPSGFGDGGFSSPSGHGNSAGGPSNLAGALSDLAVVGGAFASAESLNSPSAFLSIGGDSEIGLGPIKVPIPLLGNLLCFINCGNSNGDQPTRPPHETSQTYQILGIQLINGQRSAAPSPKPPAPNYGVAPRYGNYCGDNWTGGLTPNQAGPPAPPIDSLDQCCATHDACYGSGNSLDHINDCNDALFSCAGNLSSNPAKWPQPAPAALRNRAYYYRLGVSTLFMPNGPLSTNPPGLP
jgi:hypothetical protein